jgi:2-dehydro-3-deoxy-D-gluconate 5-dehydrogenase
MAQNNETVRLQDLLNLEGKVAIVTGGARGIGHGIVMRLAEAGASVLIADRTAKEAEDERDSIIGRGGKADVFEVDLENTASGEQIIQAAVREFGRVDILVNNAGIYPFKPAMQMTVEEWDHVQNVNLRAMFLTSTAFASQIGEQSGGGAIVNIGSIDAIHPSAVGLAAYDASKGGVLMFSKNFALEVAPMGIRVNMIAPGGITTEGTSAGLTGMTPEQLQAMQQQFMALIPMGRMGAPDDIATVALALATPMTAYMTGAVVVVDGGRLLS